MRQPTARHLRRLVATALVGTVVASLAACAPASEADGPTKITFAYLWTAEGADVVESLIEKFNKSQDDIEVVGVVTDTTKQLAAMSASKGTFDISDHFGADVKSWASKGILAPLDETLATAGIDVDDFVPSAMEQMKYEDKIYSVPILVHTLQLISNQELLAEAGLEAPQTTGEFYDAIDAMSVTDADGTIQRLGWGFSSEYEPLLLLGWANGGEWDTADGPTPADPKNVAALTEFQERYVNAYGADKIATFRSGFGDYLSDADPFYTDKLGMVFDGEWHASTAPSHAPDLDWGVSGLPVSSPALDGTTYLYSSTLYIPANAPNKEAAGTFLAWMLEPEQMVSFAVDMVNLPSRTSVLEDPAFAELKNFGPFLESLTSPNLKTLGGKSYSAEYQADLTSAFSEIILGTKSAQQALEDVAERAKSYDR